MAPCNPLVNTSKLIRRSKFIISTKCIYTVSLVLPLSISNNEKNIDATAVRFVDKMASDGDVGESVPLLSLDSDTSQEASYTPIRVLGRGAFGEAILYRRIEV